MRPLRQLREGRGRLEDAQPEERREQVPAEALARALRLLELLGRQQPRAQQRHAQRILRVRRVHELRVALAEVDPTACGPTARASAGPCARPRRCARRAAPASTAGAGPGRHRVGAVVRRPAARACGTGAARTGLRAAEAPTGGRSRTGRRAGARGACVAMGRPAASTPARTARRRAPASRRDRPWAGGPAGRGALSGPRARHGRRPTGRRDGRLRDRAGRTAAGRRARTAAERRGRAVPPQLAGERVAHLGEAPREGELQAVVGDLDPALDGAAVDEQLDGRRGQGPPRWCP